jgi:glycosyltransferase involved in cell wall biosynthesis
MDSCRVDSKMSAPVSMSASCTLRCLWISRHIPFPSDDGAKVYSANLAQSLAQSGMLIRFMGLGSADAVPNTAANVEWLAVPGKKRSKTIASLGAWPIAAAIDATKAYRALLEAQLREPWDAVVLDSYATGWALDRCLAYRDESHAHRPVLVHVSHNHEEILWGAMAREARGSALKRLALRRNAIKVGALERRIVRNIDLLTTITNEDLQSLGAGLGQNRSLALTPGYTGWIATTRRISVATPRRVLIMGSFQWVVKQENLVRFVEIADPIFKAQGIELDIVGDVPPALLAMLRGRCRATQFHGFVSDASSFLSSARMAVVPESIGGGFKLKFLDYIFGRVPVATVSQATAGLPAELQCAMLSSDGLSSLVRKIVSHVDCLDELNRMQESAFTIAKSQFKWSVRGERFRRAVDEVRQQAAGAHALSNTPLGAEAQNVDLAMS